MMDLPKNIYFYWGNKTISFLRYMTLYSFRKLNPDWKIILVIKKEFNDPTEWNKKNKFIYFNGKDYFHKLKELNITIQYLETDYSEISNLNLSDVHISDLLGWKILADNGGVIADTDIIFIKPLDYDKLKNIDIGLISFSKLPLKDYIPVSMMIGKRNEFFQTLYNQALKRISDQNMVYESLGSPLIKKVFGNINKIKSKFNKYNVVNLASRMIFPFSEKYPHPDYAMLTFGENNIDNLHPDCIGMHWYGGVSYTQIYENIITHKNFNKFRNTMSEMIKITYDDRISIIQCVSTAIDMMRFATKALIQNSGYYQFDYIVVTWNATQDVKEYLNVLQQLYDFIHVFEYQTNNNVGYVPNLRGMMNLGFDEGFKLNNYCGLVNTDMYFGKDWLKNLVKYKSEDTIVNSVHITAFMKRSNVITEDLGHTIEGQFNHKRFNEMYHELFDDRLETEEERGTWIDTNTMPYIFHKKYWELCGPWELILGDIDSPDVRFFRRCHEAGAKFTMSHSSIVYHYQAVERNMPRHELAKDMVNEN